MNLKNKHNTLSWRSRLRIICDHFHIRTNAWLPTLFILGVFLPSAYLAHAQNLSFWSWFLIPLRNAGVLVGILCVWVYLGHIKCGKIWRRILAIAAACFYLLTLLLMVYWAFTGHQLDYFFLADSYSDIVSTGIATFGLHAIILGCVFFLGVLFYSHVLIQRAAHHTGRAKVLLPRQCMALLLAVATIAIGQMPVAYGYVAMQVKHIHDISLMRAQLAGNALETPDVKIRSDDNVFIVQLESTNALAMGGKSVIDGKAYTDRYDKVMRRIAKDGIYYPYFWGNTVQTNRGQETMLCGIHQNIDDSYSYRPEELPVTCVPKRLVDAGYSTEFFMGYDDITFANTDEFMKVVGFQELHAEDILEEDDLWTGWGYDDCIVYQRVFEYLEKKYPDPKKLMAYISLSSNHLGFGKWETYEHLAPFDEHQNFLERYLNSAVVQDYCLDSFYDAYKEYAPDNSHLFILGDHSWPVGNNGTTYNEQKATTDNFLIPFVYIPPRADRDRYAVGTEDPTMQYSQTDLPATILELLSFEPLQNSLVPALRADRSGIGKLANLFQKDSPYEECHMLNQPYGGTFMAVVRGNEKLTYSFVDKTVTRSDLATDLLEKNPVTIHTEMELGDFLEKYECERFR